MSSTTACDVLEFVGRLRICFLNEFSLRRVTRLGRAEREDDCD